MTKLWTPETDGVDHINVYSRGSTKLGKQLSNLADIDVVHPKYGKFRSMEGLWYWLSLGRRDDLREKFSTSSPWEAKAFGKHDFAGTYNLRRVDYDDFQADILQGISSKIYQHQDLADALKASTLPFAHYFLYGSGGNYKVIDMTDKYRWQLDHISKIRTELQGNTTDVQD